MKLKYKVLLGAILMILLLGLVFFSISCSLIMVPEYHGPITDHYDGQYFYNLEPTEEKSFWDVLKWRVGGSRPAWPKAISINPAQPEKFIEGKYVRLTFVGHASVLLQTEGLNFLIDPVWSKVIGPTNTFGVGRTHPPGIEFHNLPSIQFVAISHNHYDHLDLPTLIDLNKTFHPLFLEGLGNKAFLEQSDIENAVDLDWWQEYKVNEKIKVIATPAKHWSMRSWGNRNQTLWLSFAFQTPHHKIYFSGDTGYGKHFQMIRERLGPMDICLLPIGAYEPRWFMKGHHMNPEDTVKAHQDLGCKKTLGIHFGTFHLTDEAYGQPEEDFKNAIEAAGLSTNDLRVLKPGESWDL